MNFSRGLVICAATLMLGALPGLAQNGNGGNAPGGAPGGAARGPAMPGLTLTTTAFPDGGLIPAKYTMLVPNPASPDLEWSNVPANTASFVLILHDAEPALQKKLDDVLHWIVFNIPGTSRGLSEGIPAGPALPGGGVQAKSLRGNNVYMGPGAPASGPYHHYLFELYALDTTLDLGPDATRADILKAIDGHILGRALLVGRFHL